jgi:hypothetical protein
MLVGISNLRWEFIVNFGAKVHRAVGKESMGVERSANGVAISCGVVVDRGIELEEGRVGVYKRTGNFYEGTSEGEDVQSDKKGFASCSSGTSCYDADCLFLE